MTRLSFVAALAIYVVGSMSAWAAGPDAALVGARHKSGPVTIRGVATHVSSDRFTLQTTTHGAYVVDDTPPTQVVEKGRTGRLRLIEGNHVGVRGYVKGRTIRAIQVRVYPVAPKQVSIRGTIAGIAGNGVRVHTGATFATIVVTSSTVIQSSSSSLRLSDLRVNDRVDARVVASGHDVVAVRIHVYRTQAAQRHVQVRGTVVTTIPHGLVVRPPGSSAQTIALNTQTRYYSGAARTSGSPHIGDQVTVYACCAGHPLVADSIHVHQTKATTRSTELRGTVVALSSTNLRLDTPRAPLIRLQSSTVFEVGAVRTTRTSIRVGDLISVRGSASGGTFTAARVHVFQASRKVSTVRGMVTAVSSSSLRVVERGATYSVVVGSKTSTRLSGRPIPPSQIRLGDHARAVGRLTGHRLQATSVDVSRAVTKEVTVRGMLTAGGSTWLQVTHSSGARETVRLDSHTRVMFQGHATTGASLFPGMRVVARGTRSGTELHASSVTASAKVSSETGRVVNQAGSNIEIQRSSGTLVRVDLPTGVVPRDGAHAVAVRQIGHGAYLRVSGYLEPSKVLRATTVTVLHPTLTVRGILSWHGGVASVRTATGATYAARFGRSSSVLASQLDVPLQPADIPSGTTVDLVGAVDLSGSLAVQTVTVRLHSTTLRAKVDSLQSGGLSLGVGGGSVRVRINSGTTISQGSHPLLVGDIVAGDVVTVYGYALKDGAVTARKISVHRRLLGLDGIVASVSDKSFGLTASDGSHTVLVSSTTLIFGVAGASLSNGMKVHVSGYLRGDAVILATRVRILKSP